jgi:stage II sporulation protein AA (anti-sigma F factor antagonist)
VTADPDDFRFFIDTSPIDDGGVLVAVSGELDIATSPNLHDVLERELLARDRVELDLSDVEFIDSTGLNVIITSYEQAPSCGSRLLLRAELSPQVLRLLNMVGVMARLEFVEP